MLTELRYSLFFLAFQKFIHLFTYLHLVAPGLRFCVRAFSSCGEQGLLSSCSAQASHSAASLLQSTGPRCRAFRSWAPGLWNTGSVVVRRLSCFVACGIFPDPGWNLSVSPALAGGFFPLSHQGSPRYSFMTLVIPLSLGCSLHHRPSTLSSLCEKIWNHHNHISLC